MKWTIVILLVVFGVCSGRPQDGDCEGSECDPVPEPEPEPEPEITTTEPDPGNTTDHVDNEADPYDYDHHDDLDEGALHHHHHLRRQAEGDHHHHLRRQAEGDEFIIRSPEPRGQVAFSVRESEVFTGPARMRFGRVLTNVGGGWDQRQAEFVAPYTGGYFFTFHAVSDINDDFTLALFKNRDHQVTAYGSKDDYQHASNSVFLKLNGRDSVSLELLEGRIYEHPRDEVYTTFTGFMLYRN